MKDPYLYLLQYDMYTDIRRTCSELLRIERCSPQSIKRACNLFLKYAIRLINDNKVKVDNDKHVVSIIEPGVPLESMTLLPMIPNTIDLDATYTLKYHDVDVYQLRYIESKNGELFVGKNDFRELSVGYLVAISDPDVGVRGLACRVTV